MDKLDIMSLFPEELEEEISKISEKSGTKIEKYRSKQIYSWLTKGV